MQKLKVKDEVILIAGKDKGKTGKIVKFKNDKVLVEGANLVKKHVKANPQINEPGGIKDVEAFIDASNVAIFNTMTNKADKVGIKILNDGKKVRVYKSNGEVIDG